MYKHCRAELQATMSKVHDNEVQGKSLMVLWLGINTDVLTAVLPADTKHD